MDDVVRPRLVLFPGLGVSGGIFARQRSLPVRLETPDWIDPREGETIERYAHRMADRIDPSPALGPLYLGGLSFGGMVALEAARWLNPRGVFLISSAYSHEALAPWVRLALAGSSATPPPLMRRLLELTPLLIRIVGRLDRRARAEVLDLVPRVNVKQCVWGAGALLGWSCARPPGVPIHRIHGGLDRIIPASHARDARIVPGAGHALNVSHHQVVNDFIARCIEQPPRIR